MRKIIYICIISMVSGGSALATPVGYPPAEALQSASVRQIVAESPLPKVPESPFVATPAPRVTVTESIVTPVTVPLEQVSTPAPLPPSERNLLNPDKVPLQRKEKTALQLSDAWVKHNIDPYRNGAGKLTYVHGASMPTVIGAPLQVSDVELEPGETINELVIGDSARWMVESGMAGNTVHLFIKPVDSGLESSVVVTTDRRVYHLRLISDADAYTPYVGFTYATDIKRNEEAIKARDAKKRRWQSTEAEGQNVDLSALNFSFRIKGDTSWKPERVYDDGRQTFIQLPKITKSGEMPVLLVRKGSNDVIANYRVKDTTMIVDGLFDHIMLVIGLGSGQEKIDIRRAK